jgi:ribose transport system permease protein
MPRFDIRRLLESGAIVWSVVVVVVLFAVLKSGDFRSADNFTNLTRQFTVLGLVTLAQFVVVVSGGVDLSLAANVRLSAIVAALVMNGSNGRLLPGVLAAVGVGAAVGLVNAFVVTRLKVEPFITTLGTGALAGGLSLYIAATPKGRAAPALTDFYDAKMGPIYAVVIVTLVLWSVAAFLLTRTPWGRHLYGVGGDANVARLSGVNVDAVRSSAYLYAGIVAGIAGLLTLATAGVGDPAAATGLEFESLAAVVIGGASLAGGRGRLVGAAGGVVLFSILGNVFNLLKVDVWYQDLTRGLIILVAASLYVGRRNRPRARSAPTQPQPASTD